MPKLSVCCVTKGEPCTGLFVKDMADFSSRNGYEFVLALDGPFSNIDVLGESMFEKFLGVATNGCIESVLNDVLAKCSGDYILRLDDDELLSPALMQWLVDTDLIEATYTFPRVNLWGDDKHYLSKLFPDSQTRLTRKDSSTWSREIHSISPHGFGKNIQKAILHYKFLVRNYEDRARIAETYEKIRTGAGLGDYKVYSLPEDVMSTMAIEDISEIEHLIYKD